MIQNEHHSMKFRYHIMKNQLLSLLIIVSLMACSQQHKPKGAYENFLTHIDDKGLKHFQFSVLLPPSSKNKPMKPQGGRGSKGQKDRGANGGRKPQSRNSKNMIDGLYRQLELRLAKSAYCREGYTEIDQFSEAGEVFIKGVCNDLATNGERLKFINQ